MMFHDDLSITCRRFDGIYIEIHKVLLDWLYRTLILSNISGIIAIELWESHMEVS